MNKYNNLGKGILFQLKLAVILQWILILGMLISGYQAWGPQGIFWSCVIWILVIGLHITALKNEL